MFKWKKAAAALAAAAMTVAGAGCTVGSGSAYAMTIDGEQINAGIYIYYSYASYMELTQTLQSQNSKLDVKDDNVVKEQKMDGVSSEEWIKNKALEYCQRYVAIEKKFDELDLSLTEEESKDVESTIDSFWDTNGETYEKNGISKNSVKSVLENTYMTNEVFLYYYGVDGEEGTTEDDLKQYYEENNARVRYIKFDLTDGKGEALDDAGKKEMKAKGYDTKRADLPRVRSLHHIDDEDYENLPDAPKDGAKGTSQPLLNGEKVPVKDESDKKAPKLKDESDKK